MIEDVYEPLARYRDEFKDKFARLAREKFKSLADASGIDVAANRACVARVKELKKRASRERFRKGLLVFLLIVGFAGAVGAGVWAFRGETPPETREICVLAAAALLALGCVAIPFYRRVSADLRKTQAELDGQLKVAWGQMEPLNALYTWDITVKLIEETVPRLAFDPYFSDDRLDELRRDFGWSDSFNAEKSILFAQSGEINGNPFVLAHYVRGGWGVKTYEGTKTISWTETEVDSQGHSRRVRRTQTLRATVTKPIPVYTEGKVLVYGNEAAPSLSFSREPSGLRGDDGFLGKWRKNGRLNELKKFSRNLTDASQFTLMSNHEFEAWFHAKDRDNEVEFRLLFTPIAQTQMLRLMKDTTVGYGDDFSFVKECRINSIRARHLEESPIDTDPARFRNWDVDDAERVFRAFNERYFKDVYFAFAPLLSVPLYQQTRTHADIWRTDASVRPSSFWEHEAIANYFGEKRFRHPQSATRNILKTEVLSRDADGCRVEVTALGYRGENREDREEVYGGDGKWHTVTIPWVEYLPVSRSSTIALSEAASPSEAFARRQASSYASVCRRSIRTYLED